MHAYVSQLNLISNSLHEVAHDTAMQAQQQHHNLLER